jgi:acyl-CoA reductase-like NAD-dependent aldehyde dehydrogenase
MAVTARSESQQASNGAAPAELQSYSPTTGELLGAVPTITPDQVQAVVDDVAGVQPFWAQLSLNDRARYLRRTAQVLLD